MAGIASTIAWIGFNGYIHLLCENFGILNKGEFFGLFFAIFSSSRILGAVCITFFLGIFNHFTYFVILTIFGLTAIISSFLIVP